VLGREGSGGVACARCGARSVGAVVIGVAAGAAAARVIVVVGPAAVRVTVVGERFYRRGAGGRRRFAVSPGLPCARRLVPPVDFRRRLVRSVSSAAAFLSLAATTVVMVSSAGIGARRMAFRRAFARRLVLPARVAFARRLVLPARVAFARRLVLRARVAFAVGATAVADALVGAGVAAAMVASASIAAAAVAPGSMGAAGVAVWSMLAARMAL
jgi:hypothetical protein